MQARPRKRLRFTCVVCGRRRGHTLLAGFLGKFRPVCEDCATGLERQRKLANEGGCKGDE
jgi:hypothetical protein